MWFVKSVICRFTLTVDANPFLAARFCLVADKNSCTLVLQSFLVNSLYIVTMASLLSSSTTLGRSDFSVPINSSFKFAAAVTSSCAT